MSYVITDPSAENIYRAMYRYYAGRQMPDNSTGVFFGFANFTKDKCIYCIEFLRRQYGLGWFTPDVTERKTALNRICNALYVSFNQSVSKDALYKFCSWVYSWARNDEDAAKYFSGEANYSFFDDLVKNVSEKVGSGVSNVVETVSYGVNYPSLDKITPSSGTLVKWGLIVGGGLLAVNYVSNKLF